MFLIDNKENCLKNLKKFYFKGHGKNFQVIAVKLNGNIFYARDIFVGREGLSYDEYKQRAKKYWSQNQDSTGPLVEALFEGEAEIIEILDEYRHN